MSAFTVTLSLVAVLLTAIYFYMRHKLSYWKRKGVPFVKPSIPFGNFGALFSRTRSLGQRFQELYNSSTEAIFGVYIVLRPALMIRDPKMINDILIKNFSHFQSRGFHIDPKIDSLANNLLLQRGDAWKKMRTIITPAFSTKKLKGMVETLTNGGRLLEKALNQCVGTEIEVKELFERYTSNAIASIGFGLEINSFENPNNDFRQYSRRSFQPLLRNMFRILTGIISPSLAKAFKIRLADRDVKEFLTETVAQNLKYREENNIVRKDFFQLLIQLRNSGKVNDDNDDDDWSANKAIDKNSEFLSVDEITAQAFLFIGAGYETSSVTMSFCLYELAKNPDKQQKVHEEITRVLETCGGKISYKSLKEMKYLDSCIDETLRMHPPFDLVSRECTKDFKIPNTDMVIEAGTPVFMSITGFHYDPTYYDNPKEFNPERFMDDQSGNKNSINRPYLSFGDGPRNCVGQRLGKLQTKIGLCIIFHKFLVELGSQFLNNGLVLNPKSGIRVPINGMRLVIKARK